MKILLIANYEPDRQESMLRFAALLQEQLTSAGHEVRVIRPRVRAGALHPSNHGLGKWLGYVDKFLLFSPELRKAATWADVVHICDHSNASYVRELQQVPHVVTCHDLFAIQSAQGKIDRNPTRWTGRRLQQMILRGLKQAQHIVCVSQATRRDVLSDLRLPEERVSVIFNGLNYPYTPMDPAQARQRAEALGVHAGAFLLHVGNNSWYKNRPGVVRIYAELLRQAPDCKVNLLMVGKEFTPELRELVEAHGLQGRITSLTNVSNEDLRALYSCAEALLFPSLQEGFGWPVLEAQACGCPVITTGRPPMNEVGGDAAIYIDPENISAAASAVAGFLATQRSSLREQSLQNAARFSSQAMAENYLKVYASLRARA